ncbi:MAG: hypothetical protein ACOCG4_06210 [Methanoculleus sp.]
MTWLAAIEEYRHRISPEACRLRIARSAGFVILFLLVIPHLLGLIFSVPPPEIFTLIASTLLLQAAAALIGLSLGQHPAVILLLLTSIAIATMIGIFEVCDLFAGRSRLIQRSLRKIDAKMSQIDYLKRYGALMLVLIIWIPGIALFGAPVVAWLFQYPRWISLLSMTAGWMTAVIAVMAMAMGLINLAF